MDVLKRKKPPVYNDITVRDLMYIDFSLVLVVLSLLGLGILFLYSASSIYAENKGLGSLFYVKRQVLWILLGLGFTALTSADPSKTALSS